MKEKEVSFAEIQKLILDLSEQKQSLLLLLKENEIQMKDALDLAIKIKMSSGDWKL